MSVSPARQAAVRAVGRVRRDGAWVQAAIEAEAGRAGLDQRDRAFATAAAYGTIAHLGTLDDLIDRTANRPSAIEPVVRDVLRVATHELLFMGTPARAAVSEGVEAVRAVRPRAVGYTNAVLRGIAEQADAFPFGDPEVDLAALARLTGHPLWMAELFVADIGRAAAYTLMEADTSAAPLYLAHVPGPTSYNDLLAELAAAEALPEPCDVPGAVLCRDAATAARSAAVHEGRAIVTDLSAQAIVASLPVVAGSVIADIAAGRGTKTVLLQSAAIRAGGNARITALDSHRFKIDVLRKRMHRLGLRDISGVVGDATDRAGLMANVPAADLVFVDAPCSGLGTLRRHPEKRWSVTPDYVRDLAALGSTILDAASGVVRPGGFVLYSTCTVTRAENASVIEAFMQTHEGEFEVVSLDEHVVPAFRRWVTDEGFIQSVPEPHGPDGHFAALMRRGG